MSQRFTLNKQDINKWAKNGLIFFGPGILLVLIAIQSGKTPQEALYIFWYWLLALVIDLLRKFISENR